MTENKIQPINEESKFDLSEAFFSTTDFKGVIKAGNDVFVRVSKYSVEELIGKPHSLIRHPDMPRAVFKLLWDYIQAKRSVVAYVKNMAKDGSYYWVLAFVVPITDGYLSVRIKPSTPLLDVVSELYKELRQIELDCGDRGDARKEGMQAATKRLLEVLKTKGFDSYDHFMHIALAEEVKSREAKLGVGRWDSEESDGSETLVGLSTEIKSVLTILQSSKRIFQKMGGVYSQLTTLTGAETKLGSNSNLIVDMTKALRLFALNTSVESTKLGSIGDTLGVVAASMDASSRSLAGLAQNTSKLTEEVFGLLRSAIYGVSAQRLQLTMMNFFAESLSKQMQSGGEGNMAVALNTMSKLSEGVQIAADMAVSSLNSLKEKLDVLDGFAKETYRSVLSLRFVQLYGNMEAIRLDDKGGFATIFDQVSDQIEQAKVHIENLNWVLSSVNDSLAARSTLEAVTSVELQCIRDNIAHIS